MTLRLFNTLTREPEPFAPLAAPKVTLYTCGPTVWNYAHIGNFRTFVFEDVLRRYLEFSGFQVEQVMNLTDVDDRTINAASAAGVSLGAHTAPFVTAFFEDRDYLRLEPAGRYPRATEHIPLMIALVTRLLERGVAYRGDDGSVYFGIDRFPAYGRLSRVERRDLKAGARVSSDEYAKEDARDFVLWKAARPDDERVGAAWDAPFGRGRPGWHLECSAMSQHYLGETIDLHAGGVDLIFPHHEDEIAQSEAATGRPFVRVWLHGEFLLLQGTKMSKRYGNFLTLRDLKDAGKDPAWLRFLFAGTHYRKQLNFTDDALAGAEAGSRRLADFRQRLDQASATGGPGELGPAAHRFEAGFRAAMDDDLDTPKALALLMDFVRDANRALDAGAPSETDQKRAVDVFDRTTGVLQVVPTLRSVQAGPGGAATVKADLQVIRAPRPPAPKEDIEAWAKEMAGIRAQARYRKDWARADEARRLLIEQGFEVRDMRDGSVEVRRTAAPSR